MKTPKNPVRVGVIVVGTCLGMTASALGGNPTFVDVSGPAGIAVHVRTQDSLPGCIESTEYRMMRGGGAIGDFNGDDYPDIFLFGLGIYPDRLFINDGDGTFTEDAASWNIDATHMGSAAVAGDINNDGLMDIFALSHGDPTDCATLNQQHKLYINNGNNTFTNIAECAGVHINNFVSPGGWGATLGDYDLDGDLDIAVADWNGNYFGNKLFRNDGPGVCPSRGVVDVTFTNVTPTALTWFDFGQPGAGLGSHGFSPRFADMNNDFYPEILWAGDFNTSNYFINDGDGTFTWYTAQSGTNQDTNGMGHTVADFNRDGYMDWYVTSIYHSGVNSTEGNKLYLNNTGSGLEHNFTEVGAATGTQNGGWGWGTSAVDINNDSWVDIIATNGWVGNVGNEEWATDTTRVFLHNGGVPITFTESALACNLNDPSQSRGLATFDMDRDGDRDVLIFANNNRDPGNTNQLFQLYRNDLISSGARGAIPSDAHWVTLHLNTTEYADLASHGIGAKVYVTSGGATQYHEVMAGSNFLVNDELSAHFGLGSETTIQSIRIDWPNGRVTRANNVPADQILEMGPHWQYDADDNGVVEVQDISHVIFALGQADECLGPDVNRDGQVTVSDISDVILRLWDWGYSQPACPPGF